MVEVAEPPRIVVSDSAGSTRFGRIRQHPDLLVLLGLALLAVLFCARFLFGAVLLPADALYTALPWSAFADQLGIRQVHNELIADLVIQNYSWKRLVAESYQQGQFPLWNPYLFAGTPFLAAGQYGALYPPGVLFYLMPVENAYGPFAALHLFLAGAFTYLFLRVINAGRAGAFVGAVTFQFAGFLVVSFLWPMILSAAIWLPLGLTACELVVRNLERGTWNSAGVGLTPGARFVVPTGAIAVGFELLAGHLEISFYFLFTLMAYSAIRLTVFLIRTRDLIATLRGGFGLTVMVAIGFALAAAQIVPFFELIRENYRIGQVNFDEAVGFALPKQHILAYVIPDLFGNPTHHHYLNLVSGQREAVTGSRDTFGNVRDYPFWGIKNYVEGAVYVGVLPLLLAAYAVVRRRDRYTFIIAGYLVFCLLLAFGTPLYRLIWLIPGVDQLHTPFRWSYPAAFCLAVLAGLGADRLFGAKRDVRLMARAILGAAGLLAAGLVTSRLLLGTSLGFADRLRSSSTLAGLAFPSAEMLYSYEAARLAGLAGALAIGGVALLVAARRPAIAGSLVGLAIAGDLFATYLNFSTASDSRLLQFVPPSIAAIKQDTGLFRTVSFNYDDVLRPNGNMIFGLSDIRGYDTVILRDYVNYWRLLEEPSGLLYSQINRLVDPRSLTSPLLDLLNVKYVLTTQNIGLPGWTEFYRGEINVYRNDQVLPRAFAVDRAFAVSSAEEARQRISASDFDPRREVFLEIAPDRLLAAAAGNRRVDVVRYEPNLVALSASFDAPGYLVIADSFFAGWRATVDGSTTDVLRANGLFRAVAVPAGQHEVVFRYQPLTFQIGGYLSFLGMFAILLGLGYAVWSTVYREAVDGSSVQRIFKNSLAPMVTQLANRLVDLAFAVVVARILGPDAVGEYAFAVVLFGYFSIFTDFGLGTYLTREVARDRASAPHLVAAITGFRLVLCLFSLPVLGALVFLYWSQFNLTPAGALTIGLFALSLFPSALSATYSAVFYAFEKMEFPAVLTSVTTIMKVMFGLAVLFGGFGIAGLGAVSVLVSVITAIVFWRLLATTFFVPSIGYDNTIARRLATDSYPLMINNFLSSVFFRIDVLLLKPIKGDAVTGYYTTAYKFIDGLNFIPSLFTLAIFPMFSRYATSSTDSLRIGFSRSLRYLLLLALPITVGTSILADEIILLFFGEPFRPAIDALRILIWFLPFSFINSVTHYVLIALNRQRYLTLAFVFGVLFNVSANLYAIPNYGLQGASVVTVFSEFALLIPFFIGIWLELRWLPPITPFIRPVIATVVMGGALLLARESAPLIAEVAIGAIVYPLTLIMIRGVDDEDIALARRIFRRETAA